MKRLLVLLSAAAFGAISLQSLSGSATAQAVATPPPPPPAVNAAPAPTLAPSATITPAPMVTPAAPANKTKPRATPAPPVDTAERRLGISGVWEVQIQRPSGTAYTHFKLDQKNNILLGQYLDANGKKYPLAGSVDGKNVRVIVSMPDGSTMVFSGTEDGNEDMIGVLETAKDAIAFTASYRPKYKWLDNLSPNPGIPGQP